MERIFIFTFEMCPFTTLQEVVSFLLYFLHFFSKPWDTGTGFLFD